MADGRPEDDLLAAEDRAALEAAGPVDLLLGVLVTPAATLAQALAAGVGGLAKAFPALRTAVMVVGAPAEAAAPAATADGPPIPVIYTARASGPTPRGRGLLALLAAAEVLGAQGVAVVSADLASLAPDWIGRLLEPVVRGEADYVAPTFTRAISEGTLTTNLLAPLTRALYGQRVHEAVGGCAALSAALGAELAQSGEAADSHPGLGVDLWLLTAALAARKRVREIPLGRKVVAPAGGQPDLPSILAELVGALFSLMDRYQEAWSTLPGRAAPAGDAAPPPLLPEGGEIRKDRMVRAFRLGLKDLLPVWEQIMPEELLAELYPLGLLAPEEFRFPPPLWARVVSAFAVSHHERRLPRDHLLRALTPLYLGRVAAFLLEAQRTPPTRLQELLEAVGRAFEAERDTLRTRWR